MGIYQIVDLGLKSVTLLFVILTYIRATRSEGKENRRPPGKG